METYEVLEKALALIEDEWNWVPHSGGVGGPYCAVGALLAVEGTCGILKVPGYQSLADAAFPLSIPRFNDTHSHAEVCDLFRAAIRNEKARLAVPPDDACAARQNVPSDVRSDDGTWEREYAEKERRLGV